MKRSMIYGLIAVAGWFIAGSAAAWGAVNSATVVAGSYVQGSVKASMAGNSYAQPTNHLNDWPLNTGAFSTVYPISLTNSNFNGSSWGGTADTIITFGDGGGLTLRFDAAIKPVAGAKEFGLFTAQMVVGTSGSYLNGNMEAAILVSGDNLTWRTLTGITVTDPTHYIDSSYKLNAPTMAYDYQTTAKAWTYGTPGTTAANLALLDIADYQTPMPDDNLFNGAGANADRLALKTDTTSATYDALFGASGGGNWFDISDCGLSEVLYVRLNAVNCGGTSGGVRLDAVFTTQAAVVPEPATATFALLIGGGLTMLRRRRHNTRS